MSKNRKSLPPVAPSEPIPGAAPIKKDVHLTSPVDACIMVAGMVINEAVNLGEINPAMARRFGERMDQVFKALMRGAQVGWGPRGDIVLRWQEPVSAMLAEQTEGAPGVYAERFRKAAAEKGE